MICRNRLCYCFQLTILNLKQNLEIFGIYLELSLPYDYHREFRQVLDDADLNLVTKAGNL